MSAAARLDRALVSAAPPAGLAASATPASGAPRRPPPWRVREVRRAARDRRLHVRRAAADERLGADVVAVAVEPVPGARAVEQDAHQLLDRAGRVEARRAAVAATWPPGCRAAPSLPQLLRERERRLEQPAVDCAEDLPSAISAGRAAVANGARFWNWRPSADALWPSDRHQRRPLVGELAEVDHQRPQRAQERREQLDRAGDVGRPRGARDRGRVRLDR